jgi:Ferritin-like domain
MRSIQLKHVHFARSRVAKIAGVPNLLRIAGRSFRRRVSSGRRIRFLVTLFQLRRRSPEEAGFASAAAVAGEMMKVAADPASPSVVGVLQFALDLEYLEAEFYTVATMGKTIDQVGRPFFLTYRNA